MTEEVVWYAAYGSNLLRSRFLAYLEGGTSDGLSRRHRGSRDHRPPRDEYRLDIPHRLFFAGESSAWGPGGVAFIDPDDSAKPTISRAYLITQVQFEDVLAQENGWAEPRPVPIPDIARIGTGRVGEGWYNLVLRVGVHCGHPVFTFTAAERPAPLRAPAPAYLDTIARGLRELGLSPEEAASYLAGAVGGKASGSAQLSRDSPG